MSEPDWAKLLSYLYENHETQAFKADEEITSDLPIATVTDLQPDEVRDTLLKMKDLGLVERETSVNDASDNSFTEVHFVLTPEGFEVGHDREQNKQNKRINTSIKNLTIVLAAAAAIQAVASVFILHGIRFTIASITGIIIVVAAYHGISNSKEI